MQDQIYKILSSRSGKPLRQIIRDTKRTDFYLDAQKAMDYGLIDEVVAGELPEPKASDGKDVEPVSSMPTTSPQAPAPDLEQPAAQQRLQMCRSKTLVELLKRA